MASVAQCFYCGQNSPITNKQTKRYKMANLCNNLIVLSKLDFDKIQAFFSDPTDSWESRFLDLNKIIPANFKESLFQQWGSTKNTHNTKIDITGDRVEVYFTTGGGCPVMVLEKLADLTLVHMEVYALEAGCRYAVCGSLGYKNGEYEHELEVGVDVLDEACMGVFGCTFEAYCSDD